MEKLCQHHTEDFKLDTRVARFHDVYGPLGSYDGNEKAPAAICRKVALAAPGGTIDVWGDAKRARSFLYVADCVEGLHRLMASDCSMPLNLESGEILTVVQLVKLVAEIAGKPVRIGHNIVDATRRARLQQDNTLLRHVLG